MTKQLPPLERRTVILLLWSAVFNGFIVSLGQTQDIIARKALHAAAWQLTMLAMIWPITNFLSIWWGRIFEQSRHKSRYFILVAVLGRLSLIMGLWISGMNQFMLLLALFFTFNSLLIPAQNTIFQKNIEARKRGKIYGWTMSLSMLVAISVTLVAGRLLDSNEQLFRMILFVTALCGFIACILLSLVDLKANPLAESPNGMTWKQRLADPIHRSLGLLHNNKPFACFERSFSIYGMGFIMMQPVLPIFLVDMLKLSYTGNFLAKGIISQIPMLLLYPFLGKWHDRLHPFRFISLFFGLLAVFPALIVIAIVLLKWHFLAVCLVYLAFGMFGIAMTGVNIAWNMGSIYFAGNEDASMYQSVHVTMTGIRGILAPLLGLLLMNTLGITSVFVVACGFLLAATLMSWKDHKYDHCRN